MSLSVSATVVKNWFQYRCERKARYEIMDALDLEAASVSRDRRPTAWAALGVDYEDRVIARLHREQGVLRPSSNDDHLGEVDSFAFLRGAFALPYATQLSLKPRRVRPTFLAPDNPLNLRTCYPDLVGVDRTGDVPVFRVIDVKATRNPRPFHKAQVAFYARILESVLSDLGVRAQIASDGEIWHVPEDGDSDGDDWVVAPFPLAPFLRLVDEFCGQTLPSLIRKDVGAGRDETFFHLYFKCEQCEYLSHCSRAIREELPPETRDLSAVPGLSHESKRTLLNLGVRSVGALAGAQGLLRGRQGGWTLQRHAERLVQRAQALTQGRTRRLAEATTFLMPARIDATLLLLVDHDPIENRLATIGYAYEDAGGRRREVVRVIAGATAPNAEVDALCEILAAVVQDLSAIDAHNADADLDPARAIHAHILFYEPAEVLNLQAAIARHLQDPRIRTGLLHMVRMFPPEDVVPEPEFRGVHHLPATALRNVIEALFAVPVMSAYDLRGVSRALFAEGLLEEAYTPADGFARPFSSLLSIDVIRALATPRAYTPTRAEVEDDVRARLSATRALANWLLAENRRAVSAGGTPLLRLAKRPFRFQATFDPLEAEDLDVLQAFEILENRSGLLGTLVDLAQPAQRRRDTGRCIADLRLLRSGQNRTRRQHWALFEVPPESRNSDLSAANFDLILTDDDPDVRLSPALWDATSCRIVEPDTPHNPGRLLVTVDAAVWDGPIFAAMRTRSDDTTRWFIDRVFRDVNTVRAAGFLRHLGAEPVQGARA
ncbi:hypothetical protein [Methylobacterium sp. 391_Methyba4]|uniref:hypothetical protein n=1 Tax=Methylobacterium sp. 391_Methyba4 TaxID=3038924 RepID=UPI00241F4F79|nr:hypothetical protein [Methylobacterium sp. 391_Methyba4]WFS09606.1 hypothetical protein P9K36_10090 [Methylobacterium sp. 391_Methyba4]